MAKLTLVPTDTIERQPLKQFTEKAYLDYSMSVILDRALAHVSDGLKPVQRRIIYAMSELGLKATAKFKKSVRTVGDVIGKFHPHGDTACYDAMVLMAQPFSYRYPLVDGQGNFGSPDDPKSFAAMRYTESRLSPYAEILLAELEQGTTDWVPNFDGTIDEPALLPARLPNILLNSTMGIAVGMATDIPPHNLNEVANACVHLLEHPEASLADICNIILAPDYPTEAEIITPREEMLEIYAKGHGSIRLRAVFAKEDASLVITALPYQVSGAKILEQIAQQMQQKKLPMVDDLRDESDHENPTRLVIEMRSNRVDHEALMAHLFATTDLEKTYRVNLNMIGLDGRPKVKDLLTILNEWLSFRTTTVTRRLQFRLNKVNDRLHILDGLLIAFLNIDEVIAIIRKDDEPKPILMHRFGLSDTQAEAILELKLRHLAKLEEFKIRTEQAELASERDSLEKTLGSSKLLKALIRKEIQEDAKKHGDARRSPLVIRQAAQAMSENELLPTEPITVVLSTNGWVRAAKGHEVESDKLNYKTGDEFLMDALGKSNQAAIFLDSTGRSYSLPAHTLPSARGQGEPLTSKLTPPVGANFVGVLIGEPTQYCVLATEAGYGFITTLENLYCKNRNGKAVINSSAGYSVLKPQLIQNVDTDLLAMVTNLGHLLLFPVKDLPQLPRGKGNKIIQIPPAELKSRNELALAVGILQEKSTLIVYSGSRHMQLKMNDLVNYRSERAKRGNKLPRGLQKVDKLVIL